MTTTTILEHVAAFHIHALPDEVLTRARAGGPDASGRQPVHLMAKGGEPVRCCLRDAQPGEPLLLFNHEPALPAPSPYRERGAVFVHAESCAREVSRTTYPTDWRGRAQVLRAYDAKGRIHPASNVHDGSDPEAAIEAVLAEPGVVEVHSRNVVYGCWMFTVTR